MKRNGPAVRKAGMDGLRVASMRRSLLALSLTAALFPAGPNISAYASLAPVPDPASGASPPPAPALASSSSTAVPADSVVMLRVMTFNVRYGTADDGPDSWATRRARLVETVRAFSPDVLGTQECLAAQADDLRAAFPEYAFVGVGRDDGARAGEMCAIFYRRDRFTKLAEGHFWLSDTPRVPGSVGWDAALTRMATWVELRDIHDPRALFHVYDTHFDHMGGEARMRSAQLVADSIAAMSGFRRAIVMGDFNAPARLGNVPSPYAVLTERSLADSAGRPAGRAAGPASRGALLDAYRALHPGNDEEATYHGFTGGTRGDRVDWILATEDLIPIECRIVRDRVDGRYPSDHFPVMAILRMQTARE